MRAAGIRELKNKLSEYLRLVAEGEVILVTNRGRVVAQLAPAPVVAPALSATEALRRLASAGKVRLARGRFPSPGEGLAAGVPTGIDVADVLEDVRSGRGDE